MLEIGVVMVVGVVTVVEVEVGSFLVECMAFVVEGRSVKQSREIEAHLWQHWNIDEKKRGKAVDAQHVNSLLNRFGLVNVDMPFLPIECAFVIEHYFSEKKSCK